MLKKELDEIQIACDRDPDNRILKEDLMHFRLAYQRACCDEESAARQRAKVKWLNEGDSNTKYFHHVVREKRHTNHIHSVCDAEGNFVSGEDVGNAFVEFFRSLLGTRADSVNPSMPEEIFVKKLSVTEANDMISQITDAEIKRAMFQIENDKAPGSDGFSSKKN